MIIRTRIDGRHHTFNTEDERRVIGEGGEAIVMRWSPDWEFTRKYGNGNYAVKLFFEEGTDPTETKLRQEAARIRQQKLRTFPKGLPRNAITPTTLVTDAHERRIIGYVMPLVERVKPLSKFMDRQFREKYGFDQMHAVKILTNLHALLTEVHRAGIVVGDFNDKNVLVNRAGEVHLIDLDSAQWGHWQSLVATPEFSDPTLLDPSQNLRSGARYSIASDWYSFAVMVYQLLTLSHPYRDGVHKPNQQPGKPIVRRQRFPDRVTTRLSVFDASVHLDKSAHHPASLPDMLGRFMRDIFTKDHRATPFPIDLLTTFRWIRCRRCGREHGREICPNRKCGAPGITPPFIPRVTMTPPSTASGARQSATPQLFIATTPQGKYVCYQDGAYRREDGSVVWQRPHTPELSALVAGKRTVLLADNDFAIVNGDPSKAKTHSTQRVYDKATVAANNCHVYWVNENSLVRDDTRLGTVTIGSVTANLTSVWVGERFGLAMVQAGTLTRVLVFDIERPGFRVRHLPPEFGTVIDAQCVISNKLAWLVVSSRASNGVATNRCYVFDTNAQLRATAEAPRNHNTWLGNVSSSALAVEDKLFVPMVRTGIARIGIEGEALRQEGIYRGAAGIVTDAQATVGLCFTQKGLLHIGRKHITSVVSTSR